MLRFHTTVNETWWEKDDEGSGMTQLINCKVLIIGL